MANFYQQISSGVRGRDADMMALSDQRAKMQERQDAIRRQKELEGQRRNILQQYFQPAVPERQELEAVGNPLAQFMGEQSQQPANLVEQKSQGMGAAPSAASLVPETRMKTIPGKEAVFDPRGAMGALFGAGDTETAKQMADIERLNKQDLNRWSGAPVYIEDPENPGVTIAAQPSTQGDGPAFRKLGVAGVTPEARARINAKNKELDFKGEDLSMDRQKLLFDQKKFYDAPEIEARKDAIADAGKQGRSADATLAILDQVEPYLDKASASDLERLARKGGSFIGLDSAAASADRVIEQAAASLTLSAPKLGGAASDRDVALYATAMGQLSSGTIQQKRDAMRFIRQKLQQYGASDQSAPRPTSASASKPADKLPSMPPAKAHAGRTVRDTDTGITYKSDGTKWVRVK